jgi:hypothetical protein
MLAGCITGGEPHSAEEQAVIDAVRTYTPHDLSLSYALAMTLRKSGYPEDAIRSYLFESEDKGWECSFNEDAATWTLDFSWKYANELISFSFTYDQDTGVIAGANANGTCLLARLNNNCVDCVCTG